MFPGSEISSPRGLHWTQSLGQRTWKAWTLGLSMVSISAASFHIMVLISYGRRGKGWNVEKNIVTLRGIGVSRCLEAKWKLLPSEMSKKLVQALQRPAHSSCPGNNPTSVCKGMSIVFWSMVVKVHLMMIQSIKTYSGQLLEDSLKSQSSMLAYLCADCCA